MTSLLLLAAALASPAAEPAFLPDSAMTGRIRTCGFGAAFAVAARPDQVFLGTYGGIVSVGVGNPHRPRRLGDLPTIDIVYGLALRDNYLYATNGTVGLLVVDITRPDRPHALAYCDTPGFAYDVALIGSIAYVADGDSGLAVVDVSSPRDPKLLRRIPLPVRALRVAASGRTAYVAGAMHGAWRCDLTDSLNPRVERIGACWANGIATAGDQVLVAADYGGLQLFGTDSVPATCASRGRYAYGVCYDAPFAFVADNGHGLTTVRVGDGSVEPVGACELKGWARDVFVLGNYAYVANGKQGLTVVDITDPARPFPVGTLVKLD